MNLVLKLISSPWFWADIVLSVIGGALVYWGLLIEKRAEKHIPPADFHHDIFKDVVASQKSKLERGWRILMTGIVVEVVAALGISVISGLEIADLTEKSAVANLEAKPAGKDAADAKLLAANTESNNLVLRARVELLQARRISIEQEKKFIEILKNSPKFPVKVFVGTRDGETEDYANEVRTMLDAAGYGSGKTNDITDLGNTRFPSEIGHTMEDFPFFFGSLYNE